MPAPPCLICSGATDPAGEARGRRTGQVFALRRCTHCGYVAVAEPWTDYAAIYDEAYYRGEGSDPHVDYAYEFEHPERTVRRHEWRGIERVVRSLGATPGTRWLDFGCGNGGLVRHLKERGCVGACGFDTGAWAERARAAGLPILTEDELAQAAGTFDIVTAIEVLEHLVDPMEVLRQIRAMLRPGGWLFVTTGNAERAPADFARWRYVAPEIHVSYFTPRALALAFVRSGFEAVPLGWRDGWEDIIHFKILKGLRVRRTSAIERLLPWRLLGRWMNARHGLTEHPAARAV